MPAPLRLIHELTKDEINKVIREIQDSIVPPALPVVSAVGTGSIALTTDYQAIPGLSVTVPRAGSWLILAATNVSLDGGDGAIQVSVSLGSAVVEPDCAQVLSTSDVTFAIARQWTSRLVQGQVVSVKARKLSGAGASSAGVSVAPGNQGSRLDMIWLSP